MIRATPPTAANLNWFSMFSSFSLISLSFLLTLVASFLTSVMSPPPDVPVPLTLVAPWGVFWPWTWINRWYILEFYGCQCCALNAPDKMTTPGLLWTVLSLSLALQVYLEYVFCHNHLVWFNNASKSVLSLWFGLFEKSVDCLSTEVLSKHSDCRQHELVLGYNRW